MGILTAHLIVLFAVSLNTLDYFTVTILHRDEKELATKIREKFITSIVMPDSYLLLQCVPPNCSNPTIHYPNEFRIKDTFQTIIIDGVPAVYILISYETQLGNYTCRCNEGKILATLFVNYRLCMAPADSCFDSDSCSDRQKQLIGCVVKAGREKSTCQQLTAEDCKVLHDHHYIANGTKKGVICDTNQNTHKSVCESLSSANRLLYRPLFIIHSDKKCPPKNDMKIYPSAVYMATNATSRCSLNSRSSWTLVSLLATVHFKDQLYIFCYVCDTKIEHSTVNVTIGKKAEPTPIKCVKLNNDVFVAEIEVDVTNKLQSSGLISIDANSSYVEFLFSNRKDQINAIVKNNTASSVTPHIDKLSCESSLRPAARPQVYFDFDWRKDNVTVQTTELHQKTGVSMLSITDGGYYQCIITAYYCTYNKESQIIATVKSQLIYIDPKSIQQVQRGFLADLVLYVSLTMGLFLLISGVVFGARIAWKNRKSKERLRFLVGETAAAHVEKEDDVAIKRPAKKRPKGKLTKDLDSPQLSTTSAPQSPKRSDRTSPANGPPT